MLMFYSPSLTTKLHGIFKILMKITQTVMSTDLNLLQVELAHVPS